MKKKSPGRPKGEPIPDDSVNQLLKDALYRMREEFDPLRVRELTIGDIITFQIIELSGDEIKLKFLGRGKSKL